VDQSFDGAEVANCGATIDSNSALCAQ
jgi:hypothetical protein